MLDRLNPRESPKRDYRGSVRPIKRTGHAGIPKLSSSLLHLIFHLIFRDSGVRVTRHQGGRGSSKPKAETRPANLVTPNNPMLTSLRDYDRGPRHRATLGATLPAKERCGFPLRPTSCPIGGAVGGGYRHTAALPSGAGFMRIFSQPRSNKQPVQMEKATAFPLHGLRL